MASTHVSADFLKQLEGYGLTTAFIYYRLPDAPSIICANPIVWQYEDIFPDFPRTHGFVAFWHNEIQGPLVGIKVAHERLIKPAEIALVGSEFRLH